jgi:hypothetical protein
LSVTVWAYETQSPAVISVPFAYPMANTAEADAGVLTVIQNGLPIARWGPGSWQRVEI